MRNAVDSTADRPNARFANFFLGFFFFKKKKKKGGGPHHQNPDAISSYQLFVLCRLPQKERSTCF
jgi:hypothetical protein